jgi:hypothetical protein
MNLTHRLNIKTTYSVPTLIAYLKTNKEEHIKEYAEAKEAYDKKKRELLSDLQDATHTKGPEGIKEAYNAYERLVSPVDATKMYDEYIALIGASDSNSIELDSEDASAIINDQWEWAVSAKFTNSAYLSKGF